MTRIIALTLAIAAGGMVHASDSYSSMALDDTTRAKIAETLTADGYEVRKVETEDGMFEAYALKNGQRYEIYLDRDLKVVKTEIDD